MKRIDLHLHTIATSRDEYFDFDLSVLVAYVNERAIDAIAITNHNKFELSQYREIRDSLPITVLPGIEVDLECGHMLVIGDSREAEDLARRCDEITDLIGSDSTPLSFKAFCGVLGDLSRYILIPHYKKDPAIDGETLAKFGTNLTAGEVTSPKKFRLCINDENSLVPVLFSDARIKKGMSVFPVRQTYMDAADVSFSSIRLCLTDKQKVYLSSEDGHRFFDALPDGLRLSTGLNVVLGKRSTGKSYTLGLLSEAFPNVKFIEQFSLLERDDVDNEKRFNTLLGERESIATREFLREFQDVVEDMSTIDLESTERSVEAYIRSLGKNAREFEMSDAYSKARLFNEVPFHETDLKGLKSLIEAAIALADNVTYRAVIEEVVSLTSLKKLAVRLILEYRRQHERNAKESWVNDLLDSVKRSLQTRTSVTPIKGIDLYLVAIERKKIEKFDLVVRALQRPRVIQTKRIQRYSMVASSRPFKGAAELKALSRRQIAFSGAFRDYESPYKYLIALREISGLEPVDHYKYFVRVEYRVLNAYGADVSGGERSEFRLLQEIADAQQHEMLLIDEPESSFDNLFLKDEVNTLLKEIARSQPVVLVTHNNTVGASIKPDYVIYTSREISAGVVSYKRYSGFPSDPYLVSNSGDRMKNFDVLMNCLEAGEHAYHEREQIYEMLED